MDPIRQTNRGRPKTNWATDIIQLLEHDWMSEHGDRTAWSTKSEALSSRGTQMADNDDGDDTLVYVASNS